LVSQEEFVVKRTEWLDQKRGRINDFYNELALARSEVEALKVIMHEQSSAFDLR
jgi:hypothetical protein